MCDVDSALLSHRIKHRSQLIQLRILYIDTLTNTHSLHTQLKTQNLLADHKAASNREMENWYLGQARKKLLHLEEVINLLTIDVKLSQIPPNLRHGTSILVYSITWVAFGT